jgi:hypothetical protein
VELQEAQEAQETKEMKKATYILTHEHINQRSVVNIYLYIDVQKAVRMGHVWLYGQYEIYSTVTRLDMQQAV